MAVLKDTTTKTHQKVTIFDPRSTQLQIIKKDKDSPCLSELHSHPIFMTPAMTQNIIIILTSTSMNSQQFEQEDDQGVKLLVNRPLLKPTSLSCFNTFSGIIRGEWLRDDGKMQSICYGTGIALSKRVVITCAHSVYLEKKRRLCDSVSFIPDHEGGRLTRSQKIYTSTPHHFIKLEIIKENQTYAKYPIPEDIALIYLSEDLPLEDFPDVGVDSLEEVQVGSEVRVAGFPSMNYYTCPTLRDIDFKRVELKGKLLEVVSNTLYHDLETSTGHSGSGILGHNACNGNVTVLGVHTHKGKKRNSGVYLSNFLLKRLAKYEIELGLKHEEYDMAIKFPERIKKEAFMELNQDQREVLSARNKFYRAIFSKNELSESDCENSEFMSPFSMEEDEEEEEEEDEMELSQLLKEQQMTCVKEDEEDSMRTDHMIAELAADNMKVKRELINKLTSNSNKELLYKWLQLENTFLQTFSKLTETNTVTHRHESINKQLIQFCVKIQDQLTDLKEKVASLGKIEVYHVKFASVAEHMSRCLASRLQQDEEEQVGEDEGFVSFQQELESMEKQNLPIFSLSHLQKQHSNITTKSDSQDESTEEKEEEEEDEDEEEEYSELLSLYF